MAQQKSHKAICDNCKSKGNEQHARIYPIKKKRRKTYHYLCETCWIESDKTAEY